MLRDDGLSFSDHLEQLSMLLYLKLAQDWANAVMVDQPLEHSTGDNSTRGELHRQRSIGSGGGAISSTLLRSDVAHQLQPHFRAASCGGHQE